MRKRIKNRELANSRIYQKGNRYYLFSAQAIEHPKTKKIAKWHPLCDVDEGELQARILANAITKHNATEFTKGDLPAHMEVYRKHLQTKRQEDKPKEPARIKMWLEANKEIDRQCRKIAEAFQDFDVPQVLPVDIAQYVDQWEGRRMAQLWHSRLSGFFAWCCRKGLRSDNPCRDVKVEKPKAKRGYMTHETFHAIRDAVMIGTDGKATQSGKMVQCYIDLCYLLYQRTTEIRLLKWSQIDFENGIIHFTPTKTERTSGVSVDLPLTTEIREVLARARQCGPVHSMYVIHTHKGQPYTTTGIGSAWVRARNSVGAKNATLKDLRSKAATDAKNSGYSLKQIRVGLAHTDEEMSEEYIRNKTPEKSEIKLVMPEKKTK